MSLELLKDGQKNLKGVAINDQRPKIIVKNLFLKQNGF